MPGATPLATVPNLAATVAPGAASVFVAAYSPQAISSGDIALIAVMLFGFGLLAVLLLLLLLKRTV